MMLTPSRYCRSLFSPLGVFLCFQSAIFSLASISSNMKLFEPVLKQQPKLKRYFEDKVELDDMLNFVLNNSNELQHEDISVRKEKFERFHFPTFQYIKHLYDQHQLLHKDETFFVGLSAPQGCGKTTLTNLLRELFGYKNINCVNISLDDFYLTGAEQDKRSIEFDHNRLLKYRGNAGTHDMKLMKDTLQDLANYKDKSTNGVLLVPRYDKTLRNGRGDRASMENWLPIEKKVDIVLLEGWMLGFEPINQESKEYTKLDNDMKEINTFLDEFDSIHRCMDTWIVLAINDINTVYQWRLQAETLSKAKGKSGLSTKEVNDFVSRFMPSYHTYLPNLYKYGPTRKASDTEILQIIVGSDRQPIEIKLNNNTKQ